VLAGWQRVQDREVHPGLAVGLEARGDLVGRAGGDQRVDGPVADQTGALVGPAAATRSTSVMPDRRSMAAYAGLWR
jgi:hypothetical protein